MVGFRSTNLPGQPNFGAIITDLAMPSLTDPAVRAALYDLWIDKGVLVFRGLTGTENHLSLSAIFGELEEHPLFRGVDSQHEHKYIINIDYVEGTEGIVFEVDGEPRGNYLPWHSDLVYVDEINRGGILRPVELPARGGETGFIDQIAAYDALPDHLERAIKGKSVLYRYDIDATRLKFGPRPDRLLQMPERAAKTMEHAAVRARSIHPMVYPQKETGRNVLNVSPWFAEEIEGMPRDESDALLAEVIDHCTRPELAYFHRWQGDDMVLWDNWRMLHCATGVPDGMSRRMRRTTITGDYGHGRFEAQRDSASAIS